MKTLIKLSSILLLLLASTTYASVEHIFFNGTLWTGTEQEATAIAVSGNQILAVGTDNEITALATKSTNMVDLMGKMVTPGFIDNHTHFREVSGLLSAVQLRGVDSKEEFVKRIGDFAKTLPKGEWILDGIWDHEAWGGELPEANWIDAVTPDNPVFLWRTDGHMAIVNSLAMKIAGLDKDTPDVPGGEITRDRDGNPLGVIKDEAMPLVSKHIPKLSISKRKSIFKKGMQHALSMGVTQIHDMGQWTDLEAFKALRENNELTMRVYSFVPLPTHERLKNYVKKTGTGDDMHRWGGLKGLVDGSLGSTTAWFYEAYDDAPDSFGFPLYDLETFHDWIKDGDLAGLNVTVHAIGDRANDWLLEQFDKISETNPANKNRRWRIEHAQHLKPAAVKRFADRGIIPSMQPYHAIDDGRWAEKRIGPERIKQTYVFKSLFDANARVTFGSDAPVAPMSVMEGLYSALTRRTLDNRNPDGWVPEQKITLDQALTAYTVNNAYAGFQEDRLGKLAKGYMADLVVLEKNLYKIAPEKIKEVRVMMTMVDGKLVYQQ